MSSIQNKLGMGIFKIQESLDKGKNKVDLIKETSKMNKIIEDVSEKKLEKMVELGILTHKKIREGSLKDDDMMEIYNAIVGFDYILFENKQKIEEMKIQSEAFKCECGNELGEGSKFCTKCGKKVEMKVESSLRIICDNCDMKVNEDSKFCPCCGIVM